LNAQVPAMQAAGGVNMPSMPTNPATGEQVQAPQ